MNAYFKLMSASASTDTRTSMNTEHIKAKTVVSPKVRKETPISKPKDIPVKANTEKVPVKVKDKHVKIETNVTPVKTPKPSGPKQVWVPKSA